MGNPIAPPEERNVKSNLYGRLRQHMRILVALFLTFGILLPVTYMIAEAVMQQTIPQCKNDESGGTECDWVNGNMAGGHWQEGMAVPQRPLWQGLHDIDNKNVGQVYTFTWSQTWVHNQKQHGIDWIVSYDQAQALHQVYGGASLNLDVCEENNAICTSLRNSPYSSTIDVPDDPFISGTFVRTGSTQFRIDEFEQRFGNRTVTLRADAPITDAVLSLQHTAGDSTFTPIGNGGDITATSTQTLLRWTLVFTTSANNAMFEFASHLGLSGNPYVDALAWGYDSNGVGIGAGGVACGSCWHQKDWSICNAWACKTESNDNQIPLNANAPFPIISAANYTSLNATDRVTITVDTGGDITGTMRFFLCGDTTAPYTDTLVNGCTQRTAGAGYSVQPAGAISLTLDNQGNNKRSIATSPALVVSTAGHYCYLTVYEPSKPAGQLFYNFIPMSDTNGTTECFDVSGVTAVKLVSFKGEAPGLETPVAGLPFIGLLFGLLGITTSGILLKSGFRRK